MKKEKKSGNNTIFLIIIILVLSTILLLFVIWNDIEKKELTLNFVVGEKLGFDLNSSALTFGSVTQGASASRDLILKNYYKKKVFVTVFSSKEISEMVTISENSFYLLPDEEKKVSFSVYVNKNSSYGAHEGKVKISIKKYPLFS